MGLSYLQTTEPSHCSTVPVAMATRDGGGNRIANLTGGGSWPTVAALSTGRAPMAAFEGMAASETSTWLTRLEKEGEKVWEEFCSPSPH